jgi:hypothetical protein
MKDWPKKISVDKRIVQILSGSTYENFPKAIKELIVNSFDADATKVEVNIDLKNETITFEDNGHGMNEDDFDFYLRIAFKSRERTNKTQLGRDVVGQFGVGFLSVFPFCDIYSIESKKAGTPDVVYAKIPCSNYFSADNKLIDVNEIPIPGGKKLDNKLIDQSYTKITLEGFSKITKTFFSEPKKESKDENESISNLNGIERLRWSLSEDLPVKYESEELNNTFGNNANDSFIVTVNGVPLKRPVYGNTILEKNRENFEQIGLIKFKYFIATNFKVVKPKEARHFKVRNLNVGVGDRTSFGAGVETGTRARLAHLTGEVHIIEGMNDLISVKRDDFNFSPDYEKLKEFFRAKLTSYSTSLDDLADVEKHSRQMSGESNIINLQLLDAASLNKKLEKLRKKGFEIIKSANSGDDNKPIRLNKQSKQIIVSSNYEQFQNRIRINGNEYKIKTGRWNFIKDIYPACKLEKDNIIIINRSYPLFKKKKYADVFLKLHSILLLNYSGGRIDKKAYSELMKELLDTFSTP